MPRSDDYINAANAFVCVLGVATADAVVPGAGSAIGGTASLNALRKTFLGRAPNLNRTIERELRRQLQQTAHLPPDAEAVILEMIAHAEPAPSEIMSLGRDPDAIAGSMARSLTLAEHKTHAMQTAFKLVVGQTLTVVLNDPKVSEELRPAFESFVTGSLSRQEAMLQQLLAKVEADPNHKDEMERRGTLVLRLAERYAEGEHTDFVSAYRGLERALEVAARRPAPSNLPDEVDAIVAEVARLT